MNKLEVRPASKEEFATAVDWAANEGWNPGLDDLEVFHACDPAGFLMGWRDGRPVSSISVVRYDDNYGFLGFYIVHPDHRGTGAGMTIWQAGMAHLGTRTIGLDGVLDQQENYKKSGFVYAGRNIRLSGVVKIDEIPNTPCVIRNFELTDIDALLVYDRLFMPANRDGFARMWTNFSADRQTKIAILDGKLVGYGTVRACRAGYKIGPLLADNIEIASSLFAKLCHNIPTGEEVTLDVPEVNGLALTMASECGLQPVFETARMYRGSIAPLPLSRTFGITTFELG